MEEKRSWQLVALRCPHCGRLTDAATHPSKSGAQPTIGDFTVCAYCLGAGVFVRISDKQLGLRKATIDEQYKLFKALQEAFK